MSAHARLSPSGADRWMTCAGSVRLIERLQCEGAVPDEDPSEWAAEGTVAHEIRADCLNFGLDPHDFIGTRLVVDGFKVKVTEEMADYLMPGIDWVRERAGSDLLVEQRIDLSDWLPRQFGTLDCGFLWRTESRVVLVINDLKYGAGVNVDAVDNRQLRIYALGLWARLGRPHVDAVTLLIDQPRYGGLKEWTIPLDELLAFGEEVRLAGVAVELDDAPLVISEKGCRWCSVRTSLEGCPARNDRIERMFDDEDGENGLYESPPRIPATALITPEKRAHIVKHAKLLTDWITQIKQHAYDLAEAGSPDPGLKLVGGGAGDRTWSDPETVETEMALAIGDAAFTRKVLSPAQAEKVLKPGRKRVGHPETWDALQRFVTRTTTRPVLVAVEDDRPSLMSVDEKFDDDQTP